MAATAKRMSQPTYRTPQSSPVVMKSTSSTMVSRPPKRMPQRMKMMYGSLIIMGILCLVAQFMVARSHLVDLHYEIEKIEYQSTKIETEKNAYYQHQAELSKLSRLKEVVASDGAALDASKVFRLK